MTIFIVENSTVSLLGPIVITGAHTYMKKKLDVLNTYFSFIEFSYLRCVPLKQCHLTK